MPERSIAPSLVRALLLSTLALTASACGTAEQPSSQSTTTPSEHTDPSATVTSDEEERQTAGGTDTPEPTATESVEPVEPDVSPTPTQARDAASVTPVISFAGVDESGVLTVNAYTPTLDTDARCTLTTRSSATGEELLETHVAAVPDAEVMWCEPFLVPVAELAAGPWTVEVAYSSAGQEGSSGPTVVEDGR